MYRYTHYELSVESEIAFRELTPGLAGEADVIIARSSIDAPPTAETLLWGEPRDLQFMVPGIAAFGIRGGRVIDYDPHPSADEASIRLFTLGSGFGALLLQRGHTVLHGNVIVIDGKAIVCLGHSGAGKSTLAMAFEQLGYPILADDVVALDARGHVLPGMPRARLWRDAAEMLGISVDTLSPARNGLEKYVCPLSRGAISAVPLGSFYILHPQAVDSMQLEPLEGHARFLPLRRNLYRPAFIAFMGLEGAMLQQVAQLARHHRLTRLRRPLHGSHPRQIAEAILEDVRAHG